MPGVSKIISIGVGHCDKCLDSVDVLLLHLGDARAGREQREAGQGLYVRISLQLEQTETQQQSFMPASSEWLSDKILCPVPA